MKKAYIQPEIELLKVSALNDFLIGSPDQDSVVEATGGATDGFLGGSYDDFDAGSGDAWA